MSSWIQRTVLKDFDILTPMLWTTCTVVIITLKLPPPPEKLDKQSLYGLTTTNEV